MTETANAVRILEKCKNDRLLVQPGRNLWICVRTDRDAPDPETVVDTAGAFLLRVLGRASPNGFNMTDILQDPAPPPGSIASWYIGAARPALVSLVSRQFPLQVSDGGARLGRSIECDAVRLVDADAPWYVVVEFDWRGPSTWIGWPASKVNVLGVRSQDTRRTDLDWLVVEAWHFGGAKLPDSSLGSELGDYVEEKAGEVVDAVKKVASVGSNVLLVVAGVVVVGLLAYGYAKRG